MKHLLFLLDYYAPHRWGIETVFENLISRLLKKKYPITLITSRFDPSLPREEHHEHFTIYRVGKGRKSFFFYSFRKGVHLLFTQPSIEIIHASTYTSAIPASILGRIFHKKTILTVHEIFGKLRTIFKPRYSRRIYQLFEWLTFKCPYDAYHCVSLYTLNSLRIHYGLPDQKLHLIYNGVESAFWDTKHVSEQAKVKWRKKFWREEKFLMLYYGHSGMSKGIDYLVDALPTIVKQHPDGVVIFNFIPAKREKEIKERILSYHFVPQVVIFSGFPSSELRELIATVDLVIAPSLAEGFGSVHSEACAMGKTLLTTSVAAIPEVVSGKVKFVSPRSSEAIVQGIKEVRRGEVVSLPRKQLSWSESVEKVEELYGEKFHS